MINVYELKPRFDARASFYGKAQILETEDVGADGTKYTNKTLLSYGVEVVRIKGRENSLHLTSRWDESATTLRHVKEFLRQHGVTIGNMTKKEIGDYFTKLNRIDFD